MTEKTPRQRFVESLEQNAREVAAWPAWMRSAISTASFFQVAAVERPREAAGELVAAKRQG